MSATRSFQKLKSCLSERLSKIGFTIQGNDVYLRPHRDTVVLLEIQKDIKNSTKDKLLFTINVGVSLNVLRQQTDRPSEGNEPVELHWRQRFGRLLPVSTDIWWPVLDDQSAVSACEEIVRSLTDHAWPEIEKVASSELLIGLWEMGLGGGLTEFERRCNLAASLMALNRKDEAEIAIQALEMASMGKGWESAARLTARKLRSSN